MTYWKSQKSYGSYNTQAYGGAKDMGFTPNRPVTSQPTTPSTEKKHGGDSYMKDQIGKSIKINKGGPDSFEGVLVAVESNYVVLSTLEGLVYINYSHVKSTTEMSGETSTGALVTPKYIVAGSFNEVLRRLTKSFVQLNWGGPEKVEGFVAEVGSDSLLLVVGGVDLMRIPLFHIKTVRKAGKFANGKGGNKSGGKGGSKSGGQGGNNSGDKGGNKSGGKGGSKSGGQGGSKSSGQGGHKSEGKGGSKSGSKSGSHYGHKSEGKGKSEGKNNHKSYGGHYGDSKTNGGNKSSKSSKY